MRVCGKNSIPLKKSLLKFKCRYLTLTDNTEIEILYEKRNF